MVAPYGNFSKIRTKQPYLHHGCRNRSMQEGARWMKDLHARGTGHFGTSKLGPSQTRHLTNSAPHKLGTFQTRHPLGTKNVGTKQTRHRPILVQQTRHQTNSAPAYFGPTNSAPSNTTLKSKSIQTSWVRVLNNTIKTGLSLIKIISIYASLHDHNRFRTLEKKKIPGNFTSSPNLFSCWWKCIAICWCTCIGFWKC